MCSVSAERNAPHFKSTGYGYIIAVIKVITDWRKKS